MASGRNGGKEGAAEASDMGKGNRYDMGKGWHLVPKQPSLPPPLQVLQRAHGYGEGTRTYEQHQVNFACVERREMWREATRERMREIAVFKGKGVKGHGGGVEGFDDLEPLALPRVGKAQKGAQGVEGKGKDPKGKRQEGLSIEPDAKRQRQATEARLPDAKGTGDETPEQTPEEAEDEQFAALKSEFSQALANLIAGIVARSLAKQESRGRVIDDGAAMK